MESLCLPLIINSMGRLFLYIFVLLVMISSMTAAAYADDYKFVLHGNITASSCTVSTENLTFNFYINNTDLEAAGSSSDWQALPGQIVKLTSCFGGTHSVQATVSGVMDDDDKDGFKNQSGNNPAIGVSVQLKNGENLLHNNDVIAVDITANHSADIPLAARLHTVKGKVTAGDIYSVINLTLTYN